MGVGEAFGAAVTKTNGNADCSLVRADAKVPHPARRIPARRVRWKKFLIRYCNGDGVFGVFVEAGMDVCVAVAGGGFVFVGGGVLLGGTVLVDGTEVSVGKSGRLVTPGTGVRVGMFGTQSLCPV